MSATVPSEASATIPRATGYSVARDDERNRVGRHCSSHRTCCAWIAREGRKFSVGNNLSPMHFACKGRKDFVIKIWQRRSR